MSFNKIQNPAYTKHYWKESKKFKNTVYHLHTASTMFKEKMECSNRNECKNYEEATTCTWHS